MPYRANLRDRSALDFRPEAGDQRWASMTKPRRPIPSHAPPTSIGTANTTPSRPTTSTAGDPSPVATVLDLIEYLHQQPRITERAKLRIIRDVVQSLAPPVRMPGYAPLTDVNRDVAAGVELH